MSRKDKEEAAKTVDKMFDAWVKDIDSEPLRTEPLGDDGKDPRGNR